VEEIIVVGSRIQRKDADSVGVVMTLTEQDIKQSGAGSVGELLQKLPSAGVSLSSNGTQGTSYGASSINLRYLGGAEGSGNRVLGRIPQDGSDFVTAPEMTPLFGQTLAVQVAEAFAHFRAQCLQAAERAHHHFEIDNFALLVKADHVDAFQLLVTDGGAEFQHDAQAVIGANRGGR